MIHCFGALYAKAWFDKQTCQTNLKFCCLVNAGNYQTFQYIGPMLPEYPGFILFGQRKTLWIANVEIELRRRFSNIHKFFALRSSVQSIWWTCANLTSRCNCDTSTLERFVVKCTLFASSLLCIIFIIISPSCRHSGTGGVITSYYLHHRHIIIILSHHRHIITSSYYHHIINLINPSPCLHSTAHGWTEL